MHLWRPQQSVLAEQRHLQFWGHAIVQPRVKTSKKLGVIGSGIIGKTTIEVFFKDNWNIDEVAIFDLNRQSAEGLASQISDGFQTNAKAAETLEEATSCDVVLFVTSAGEPYVSGPQYF